MKTVKGKHNLLNLTHHCPNFKEYKGSDYCMVGNKVFEINTYSPIVDYREIS